jgi:hypothetical protein
MTLWMEWWKIVRQLRPAFARNRTFLWFAVATAGMSIRSDHLGVTSMIRALGLTQLCYDRLLDCFHSRAIRLDALTRRWVELALLSLDPFLFKVNNRIVLLADGIKVAKSGRKMPGVKNLHQESNNNNKKTYFSGHSCQALALVVRAANSFFAVPLACRIHDGIKLNANDEQSLFDKLICLLKSMAITRRFYMVADSYYAASKVIKPLLKDNQHLITAVRLTAVGYEMAPPSSVVRRGRKRVYAGRVKLHRFFHQHRAFIEAPSPIYGEKNVVLRYRVLDLGWKPVGGCVRFVLVIHPTRGRKILLCTDTSLSPLQIIEIFGIRFKIEVSFKQAVHTIGTYAYHFWLRSMQPRRRKTLNQYISHRSEHSRYLFVRKLHAYHVFIQLGFIVQGILQILSVRFPAVVWKCFGSWIRTARPDVPPSEFVTIIALRNTLPEFLADSSIEASFAKFIRERIDITRSEGLRLVA